MDTAGSLPGMDTAGSLPGMDTVDLAELDALESQVRDVERALARLDDGTYGTCEVCGDRLSPELLARAPAARHCPDHRE